MNKNRKTITETLANIFHNVIPHKTKKLYYRSSKWINKPITLTLKKKKFKFTIMYENYISFYNRKLLSNQAKKCTAFY